MSLRRFVSVSAISPEQLAVIEGSELHHLRDVMRLHTGAEVAVLGPDSREHCGRIESIDAHRATIRITETLAAVAGPQIILAAGVIKGPRMDFLVEKAAELGTTELWPILCSRSVVRASGRDRLARWRRIALAAAKQSLGQPLVVREPMELGSLCANLPPRALSLICTSGAEPFATVIRREHPRTVVIACGPEGGFDSEELRLAKEAGMVAASLSRNRLRAETAAITAVGIAANIMDEPREGPGGV